MTLHVLGRRAFRRGPAAALEWAREANWLGQRVFAPLALVLLLAGILLVGESGYEHSQAWIGIAYLGWLIAVGIGSAVHPRAQKRTEDAAARHGESSAEALAAAGRTLNINSVELTLLLLIVVDMALKPGGPG